MIGAAPGNCAKTTNDNHYHTWRVVLGSDLMFSWSSARSRLILMAGPNMWRNRAMAFPKLRPNDRPSWTRRAKPPRGARGLALLCILLRVKELRVKAFLTDSFEASKTHANQYGTSSAVFQHTLGLNLLSLEETIQRPLEMKACGLMRIYSVMRGPSALRCARNQVLSLLDLAG